MNEILFTVGDLPIRVGEALIGFGALALVLLLAIAIVIARSGRRGAELAMAQAIRADELEERLSEMLRAQSESTGRVDAMAQALVGRQAEMARAVNERLDSVTHRVGQSMEATTRHTMDSLRVLHERLGIIDNAHKNLTDLTSQVTTLRDVLANKQSRGAFGQARMEAIVQDGMPQGLLRIPVHALDRQAAGLRGVPARPAPALHRREISAGGDDRAARRAQRRGKANSPPSACAPT